MTGDLARSFERVAEDYELGRSEYPESALDAVGLPASIEVLDLAAGTGKLTRQLVHRYRRVVAVEPLDGMRAILERVVPEADARRGFAEAIPVEDGAVDAVFVGDAFHWFGEGAVEEIARVLRPAGTLAILFNRPDGPVEPPLPREFGELLEAEQIEKPPAQTIGSGLWRRPFPGPFGPFEESSFRYTVGRDANALMAMYASWSTLAAIPEPRRAGLLAELRALLPESRYISRLRTELHVTSLQTSS